MIIARQVPTHVSADNYIRLSPLDASDVKSYVNHHNGNIQDLESVENLHKLIELTSGLPKHIDRIIDSLKVASFEELLASEKENSREVFDAEQIPKSLKQAISSLVDTTDKMKLRSLNLLKILTILSNGEVLNNLKRFDGREPIYIENANQLEQLSLLEVITSTRPLSNIDENTTHQVKILRAPRQIRDYINAMITDNERDKILKLACDMYFGDSWRSGKLRNIYSSSVIFGGSQFFNVDNCHIIIRGLMSDALNTNSDFEIERAALLSINFCQYLLDHEDYKNAANTCEEIYNGLKYRKFNRLKASNAKLYGQAIRMMGNKERSNQILTEALEIDGNGFSNDQKNDIYINLGFTYILQKRYEKAIECAKSIEKTATSKDAHWLQAKYIHAQATLKDIELIKKLKSLESEAKKANIYTLTNTISLNLVEMEIDEAEKNKRLL